MQKVKEQNGKRSTDASQIYNDNDYDSMFVNKIRSYIQYLFGILIPILVSTTIMFFLIKPDSVELIWLNVIFVILMVMLVLIYVFCGQILIKKKKNAQTSLDRLKGDK